MNPEREQLIAGAYLHLLGGSQGAEILEYTFGDVLVKVLRIQFPYDDGVVVTFCGGVGVSSDAKSPHYFVSVAEAEPEIVADLVASTQHYDTVVARLDETHTFPLGQQSPVRKRGFDAAVVLDAGIFGPFEDAEAIERKLKCHFLAVIPITADERAMKTADGIERLLDAWQESGRGLIQW